MYTGVATVGKLALGMWLALLLNRHFKGKRLVRASMLLPFIVPTVLSTFAWKWMFDPTFSVLNWTLYHAGVIQTRIGWLTDPTLALGSIIIVNVWRGMPFYAITLLAGLQTVSPELHEAAAIDGANAWQRFWRITWPLLLPVTMVVTLFSVIQTFADFQLVYVLTGGGPANATHLFATYAYQIGIITGLLGEGAAASLAMFPLLFIIVVDPALVHPPGGGRVMEPWRLRRGDGRGSSVEEVVLLLHSPGPVRRRDAVPLLLDADHGLPARRRAVPAVAGGQQHAVLDPPSHLRALRVPVQGDDVRERGSTTRCSSRSCRR